MKPSLLGMLLFVTALVFAGCGSLAHPKVAPAVYRESKGDASCWTLMLNKDGKYCLMRVSPDQTARSKNHEEDNVVYLDVERGIWQTKERKIILESDKAQRRTFTVQHNFGGQFLEDEAHTYPRLYWAAEELNYD